MKLRAAAAAAATVLLATASCSSGSHADKASSSTSSTTNSVTTVAPAPVVTLSSCTPGNAKALEAVLPGTTWTTGSKPLSGGTCTTTATATGANVTVNYAPTGTATKVVRAFAKDLPPVPGHKALPDLGLSGASAGEYIAKDELTTYILEIATPTALISVQAVIPDAVAGKATPAQVAAKLLTWAVAQKP